MKIVLLLALLALSVATYEFDYLIMPMFVASGQPKSSSRCHIPPGVAPVSLHGLWPTDWHSHGPNTCPGDAYDDSKIQDLAAALKRFWPTYMENPTEQFHEHEWTKHGTCAALAKVGNAANGIITDQHSYFSWALTFLENMDPMGILAKDNIVPGRHGKSFPYSDIVNALHYGTGHLISINCHGAHGKTKTLIGMTACFDKELNQIDCPLGKVQGDASSCGKSVQILPNPTN